MDNYGEYIAYTIPIDSNSIFRITGEFTPTGGVMEVIAEFESQRSRNYAMLQTTNLAQSLSWSNMTGNVRGNDDEMELVTTNSAATGMYRVEVNLPGTP
jgi:hypothetical protein